MAAINGYASITKMLLEAGADPTVLNRDDSTALTHAASKGHVEIMPLLVDAGADLTGSER
jgi:ankyrin repeat protein